ncbi:DUF3791 domain-containing protein [Xylanibacter caecicola]|uniref:DUF3791 domain-containing protein n=1 Tax=Xylanibacter caecicola TaxID=2736294 RepID=UPI001C130D9E|nr:DUF3791 domain-containing protein [Xylanibacter caecicola]
MTEESKLACQAIKSANIIKSLCELYGVSLKEATDIYYQSDISELMEEGVAELHCRSDKYLATLIWDEHKEDTGHLVVPTLI